MRDEGAGDVIKRREAWLDQHATTLAAALTAPDARLERGRLPVKLSAAAPPAIVKACAAAPR